MNRLQLLLQDKHTSGAAIVLLLASILGHIADTWFPQFSKQIASTIGYIKEGCEVWIGLNATGVAQLAGLKKDVQDIKTGNTDQFLPRPEPQTPKPKDPR